MVENLPIQLGSNSHEEQATRGQLSRRGLVTTAVWATPVVATAVVTPLAAASVPPPKPLGSDLVLSYAGGTTGSTDDISAAVIAWIKKQLLDLGPKVPPEPPKPEEPESTSPMPQRKDFRPGWRGDAEYQVALNLWRAQNPGYVKWLAEYAEWQIERAKWAAENAEVIAQRIAWEIAIGQLERMMKEFAEIGKMLFSASISYPQQLSVTNTGPLPLLPGDVVTVVTTVDSSLVNAHLPSTGEVSLIQTGGTVTMSHIVTGTVPVGGVVFTQPLRYNPASVTLNIRGTTTNSSVVSELTPRSQDTDVNDHGDLVSAPIGVTLNVLTGDLQEVLDRWEKLTSQAEDLKKIWDLISPYIDWEQIIRGIVPLPQLP